MQEIKCPKCGEVFQVDESGYAAIVRQVRDKEFEKELSERKAQYLSEKENAVLLAQTQTRQELAEISGCRQSLRQRERHGSWQRQTPVPGRKSFLSEQEKALSQRTLRSAFKCQITSVQETADKDIALAVSKRLPRKKSRSTKWIGRFMT